MFPSAGRSAAAARRGWAVALTTFALVVVAAGGALAAVGTHRLSHDNALADARSGALAAARQIAVDFAAYDYRRLDQDFARVAGESTGSFRDQYLKSAAGVKDLIIQVQAVSTAQVAGEGLVDGSTTHATVVLALNRTVINTKVPKGQSDSFGLELDLVNLHGRWLASQVKPL